MSPRLVIILAVMGIAALGVGVANWIVQPYPVSVSGREEALPATASDAAQREHREKFFAGDTDRDIRGGQEMKPKW